MRDRVALVLTAATAAVHDVGARLPPTFEDMLGWHTFVDQVAAAWDRIPLADRRSTSIVVDNYGEAAAIDLYGPAFGLPPALSGQNQYGLWGLRGQSPRDVMSVQDDAPSLRRYCVDVAVLGETAATYARRFEQHKAIAFCRGLHPSLAKRWPQNVSFE